MQPKKRPRRNGALGPLADALRHCIVNPRCTYYPADNTCNGKRTPRRTNASSWASGAAFPAMAFTRGQLSQALNKVADAEPPPHWFGAHRGAG